MYSDSKIVVTLNSIQVTEYSENYHYDFKRPAQKRLKIRDTNPATRISSMWRARKNVRLLLESNAVSQNFVRGNSLCSLFVTLTFADNITDVKKANSEFNKFIKRLNYSLQKQAGELLFTPLKYLVVIEFQKRGAVHYHIIFFNFPVQKDTNKFLSKIWRHGFTFNNTLKNINHLKNYVTKYFVKSLSDERLKGKKHYFCSRKIERPFLYRNKQNNREIISVLQNPSFETEYIKNGKLTTFKIFENHPLIPMLYEKELWERKKGSKITLEPKQQQIRF